MTENPQTTAPQRQRSLLLQSLAFAWDFGIVVVVPIVVLGIGGRFLDRRMGTEPWLFLAGVVVSIGVSTVLLVVRLKKIIAKLTDTKPKIGPTST